MRRVLFKSLTEARNLMKFKIRFSLLLLGCLAVLVMLAVLMLYVAARHMPEFYREALDTPAEKLTEGSDSLLRQAAALESAVNKGEPWEILITAEEINGWLAVDLVENHPDALPPTVHYPRVAIEPDGVSVGCLFEQGGASSVLNLKFQPSLSSSDTIALRIVHARLGLLPVSLAKVLDRFDEAVRRMQFHLEWRHDGGDPVALLSLPAAAGKKGGRSVRIEKFSLGQGEMLIAGTAQKVE